MYRFLLSHGVEKFFAQIQYRKAHLFQHFVTALEEIAKNPFEAKALSGRN